MTIINSFHNIFHGFGDKINISFFPPKRPYKELICWKAFINAVERPVLEEQRENFLAVVTK